MRSFPPPSPSPLGLLVAVAVFALAGPDRPPAAAGLTDPAGIMSGTAIALSGEELVVDGSPVRLDGIAAPALGQICQSRHGRDYDCFAIATAVLARLVEGQTVLCQRPVRNSLGQTVAACSIGGLDLGAAMVARGWAFAYRGLGHDYSSAEAYAQSRRLGLWAGRVEKPWQWLSRTRQEQAR